MFSDFFRSLGIYDSVRVTLIMSFWSTLISGFLGILLGFLLERASFFGKGLVIRILRTMMGAPPVAVGLIAYMFLRKKGPLGDFRLLMTIQGMIFAQVLIITPIIAGLVHSCAVSRAPEIREFARNMGASGFQTFSLFLSEFRREIMFAVLTGYSRSISEVGAVFLVGGNIKNRTRTMTTAISTLKNAGEFKEGIILGILLLLIAFLVQSFCDFLNREETEHENY